MSPQAKVYIVGFPNGKCYVGITIKTIEERFTEHVMATLAGSKYAIHHALRKYGPENVELMAVVKDVSWDQAADLEVWWISKLNTFKGPGYNMTAGGEGMAGHIMTAESRAKMSRAKMGNQHTKGYKFTDETKARISRAMMGNQRTKGYRHTAEARQKMRMAAMGNQNTKGHKLTATHKDKISKAKLGNQCAKGYKHTAEAKARMKEARRLKREATKEHYVH